MEESRLISARGKPTLIYQAILTMFNLSLHADCAIYPFDRHRQANQVIVGYQSSGMLWVSFRYVFSVLFSEFSELNI